MSKLYLKYIQLKNSNPNLVYLFKTGIFYIALEDDALKLSQKLKLKLGKLNETIVKVGFPVSSKEHYIKLLNAFSIPFQFIDDKTNETIAEKESNKINDNELNCIINNILSIDFNNITFRDAFNILLQTQKKLKAIYLKENQKR